MEMERYLSWEGAPLATCGKDSYRFFTVVDLESVSDGVR